jgi:hypothetical protein
MKRAYLYAINDYNGSDNDLNGCLNDQQNVIEKLREIGGFEIHALQNSQVTRGNVVRYLSEAVNISQPGDMIVIHYSGHGTQIIDDSKDELDGIDEALYLYDGPLSDDILSGILSQLRDGVICVVLLDSCFSGTATRKIGQKKRFKPFYSQVDAEGNLVNLRANRSLLRSVEMKWILMSGCSESETSCDAFFLKPEGAFTHFAMKILEGGITYKQWYSRLRKYLPSKIYSQTPQLEGPEWIMDEIVFGSKKKKCWLKFW